MKPFPADADWIIMQETPRKSFANEEPGDVLHAIPINDLDEHDISMDCWCQPIFDHRDLETLDELITHRFVKKNLQ